MAVSAAGDNPPLPPKVRGFFFSFKRLYFILQELEFSTDALLYHETNVSLLVPFCREHMFPTAFTASNKRPDMHASSSADASTM